METYSKPPTTIGRAGAVTVFIILLFAATAVATLPLMMIAPASAMTLKAAANLPLDQDDELEAVGDYIPDFFAETQDIELNGTTAYVFGVGGLALLNISNPTDPYMLGRYVPPGDPFNRFYRGATDGEVAVGGGRENLMSIIDVRVSVLPTLYSVHGQPGQSYEGLAMRGHLVFACRHGDGLEIVDIFNPLAPVSLGEVTTLVNSWDVELAGDLAYIADGLGGLAVVDISDPSNPIHLASVPTAGAAVDVALGGDTESGESLAVVASGSAGIEVFDLADPAAPVLVGQANTSGLAITIAMSQSRVYVADWDDVEVFDVSNPAAPEFVGGEDTPVRAMGLAFQDDLVVVADWSRVRIYSPGPTIVGDLHVPFDGIAFGDVPLGATVDTTLTIGNTGGGSVSVTSVEEFSANFAITSPTSFVIPPGGTHEVTVSFTHAEPGYDATFLKIESDDPDEPAITLPVTADDHPDLLDVGDEALEFTLTDIDGAAHRLSNYRGRVVVLAFFANW